MAHQIDDKLRQDLLEFVQYRVKCIRQGDRKALNATYDGLERRNKYNAHDYDWYLNLIENGFGVKIKRIDIEPVKSLANLPFAKLATYPFQPEYKVFIETVTGRRTLWLIRIVDGKPVVVLPALAHVADSVATGRWHFEAKLAASGVTVRQFNAAHVVKEFAESIATHLLNLRFKLKFETLRAVAVDCFPWYSGTCFLAILTTQEDYDEKEYGKWAIAEWRWDEIEFLSVELMQLLHAYYEGRTSAGLKLTLARRADKIFICAAKALQSNVVQEALRHFKLSADFELGVFNPDDSNSKNFCHSEPRRRATRRR